MEKRGRQLEMRIFCGKQYEIYSAVVPWILNYFDELTKETCGVCDVCIGARKKHSEDALRFAILEKLRVEPLSIEVLVDSLHEGTEAARIELIRILIDEGKLRLSNDLLHLG